MDDFLATFILQEPLVVFIIIAHFYAKFWNIR